MFVSEGLHRSIMVKLQVLLVVVSEGHLQVLDACAECGSGQGQSSMTEQTHLLILDAIDPCSELGISYRAASGHGCDSNLTGASDHVCGGGTPPVNQRVVEILDIAVSAGMRPHEEVVPETEESVATLIGILDGLGGELGRKRHDVADVKGGGVGVSSRVGPSAHERGSITMTSRSD